METVAKLGKPFLQLVAVLLVFALAFYLARYAEDSTTVQGLVAELGYAGVLAVSVISGFNFIVPIPAISFLPLFAESGLNIPLSVIVITLGMTIADSVTYFLGRVSRTIARGRTEVRIVEKLDTLRGRYPKLPLILLFVFASVAPLPNEILLVPFGFIGYRLREILLPVFAGNALFNSGGALIVLHVFDVWSASEPLARIAHLW